MKNSLMLMALLAGALLLSGCGLKGNLYMPDQHKSGGSFLLYPDPDDEEEQTVVYTNRSNAGRTASTAADDADGQDNQDPQDDN